MSLHRWITPRKAFLLASLLLSVIPTAHAIDVAFGYLGKDNVIDQVMYYRNGLWQTPLPAFITPTGRYSSGVEPHDAIVNAWLDAKNGSEADCAHPDPRQPAPRHCSSIRKLGQPLSATTAKELSAFLHSLPTRTGTPSGGEPVALPTPNFLKRLLAWRSLKSDTMDMRTYAKVLWGTSPSAFINWFDVNRPDAPSGVPEKNVLSGFLGWFGIRQPLPASAQASMGLLAPGTDARCHAGSPRIKIQPDKRLAIHEGWISTQKWGYRWIPFEKLASLAFDPESGAAAPSNVEPPLPFAALLAHVKKNWEAVETKTIPPKLKLGAVRRLDIQKRLNATPFSKLTIERAVSYQNRWALLMFYGEKSYRLPTATPGTGAILNVYFRAWAIRHPEGRTEWIASRVDLDPAAAALAHVDESITAIAPYALLELDGKQFVVAASNLQGATSTIMRTEIFELANYQFKSRGLYAGACGEPNGSK